MFDEEERCDLSNDLDDSDKSSQSSLSLESCYSDDSVTKKFSIPAFTIKEEYVVTIHQTKEIKNEQTGSERGNIDSVQSASNDNNVIPENTSSKNVSNVIEPNSINDVNMSKIEALKLSNFVENYCEISSINNEELSELKDISKTVESKFSLYKIIQCVINLWKYLKVNDNDKCSTSNTLSCIEKLIEDDTSQNLQELTVENNISLNVNLPNINIYKSIQGKKNLTNYILQFIFFINMQDIAFIKSCSDIKIDLSDSKRFFQLNETYPTQLVISSKIQSQLIHYLISDNKNLTNYLKEYFKCVFNSNECNFNQIELMELIQQSYHTYLSIEQQKLLNKMPFCKVKICNVLPGYYVHDSPVPYAFNLNGEMTLIIGKTDIKKRIETSILLNKQNGKQNPKTKSKKSKKK